MRTKVCFCFCLSREALPMEKRSMKRETACHFGCLLTSFPFCRWRKLLLRHQTGCQISEICRWTSIRSVVNGSCEIWSSPKELFETVHVSNTASGSQHQGVNPSAIFVLYSCPALWTLWENARVLSSLQCIFWALRESCYEVHHDGLTPTTLFN